MFPHACRELRALGFNVTKLHEYRNPVPLFANDPHDLVIVMCEREHAPMLNTYDRAWDVEDVPIWDVRRGVERIVTLVEALIDELRVA